MPTPPRPPVTPTAKPKESPTAGPVLTMFRASDVCSITSIKEEHTDGKLIYIEHFSCVRTASDPRFSGDVEFDVTTTFDPIGTPAALWEGTFTLTNDGGSWEGTGRGTVAIWEDIGLKNYGDVSYTGEGAYAGLTARELLSATDQTGTSVGWIQE
jgi:hypothetical protein